MRESIPIYESFAVAEDRKDEDKVPKLVVGFEWSKFLSSLNSDVANAPQLVARVTKTLQSASLPVTPLPMASIPAGRYRVSYWFMVTRASSATSTILITITWTRNGQAQSQAFTAVTSNSTVTGFQFATLPLYIDADTPISFSTTYGSTGATPMQYEVDVTAEAYALDQVA